MKILIADKFPEAAQKALAEQGMRVTFEPDAQADALPDLIGDHEVLVVRSTKVNAEVFKRGKALQLVVRAGAGYNTIDVAAASDAGVFVANCPGKNSVAVAELAMGLMLAVDRRIPQAHAELSAGSWNKKEYGKADGLLGKTLGVVGSGQIGQELITRARGFGLRVNAWSRSLTKEKAKELGVGFCATLNELAESADIVSIHLAHSKDTAGIIGEAFLASLPAGAMVINTSRGGIVDEAAMLKAMQERGLRYAADVYDGEPGAGKAEFKSALTEQKGFVGTPHIGASTAQAEAAVADEAMAIIVQYAQAGRVRHCVNLSTHSPAAWTLIVRHGDKVGVLASVLDALRGADINVQEVENIIFEGANTACARLRLSQEPEEALLAEISSAEHVIDARVIGDA